MVAITACECFDRPPHTHVPEKALVRLDNEIEIRLDATHFEMNRDRITEVIEVVPGWIEFWESPREYGSSVPE